MHFHWSMLFLIWMPKEISAVLKFTDLRYVDINELIALGNVLKCPLRHKQYDCVILQGLHAVRASFFQPISRFFLPWTLKGLKSSSASLFDRYSGYNRWNETSVKRRILVWNKWRFNVSMSVWPPSTTNRDEASYKCTVVLTVHSVCTVVQRVERTWRSHSLQLACRSS